jgi:hypothetical protein
MDQADRVLSTPPLITSKITQIVPVEVKQVESDHEDLGRSALEFVLQNGKSVVPSAAGATTSPSIIADPALMCQASEAIFLKRLVQS